MLTSLSDDGLTGALAALKHCVEIAAEAEGRRDVELYLGMGIDDICREFTRRGLESDTVTALEL